jgi:hypothetical protein
VICKVCGFHNEAGAEFCGSCGTFLEWAGETAADGSAVPGADAGDIAGASTAPVPPPPSAAAPTGGGSARAGSAATPAAGATQPTSTPPRPSPEFVGPPCPVCGLPVPTSRTFCPHCGADTRAPHAGARAAVVEAPPPTARRLPSIGPGPIILLAAFVIVALGAVLVLPGLLGGGALPSEEAGLLTASPTATAEPSVSAPPSEAPSPSAAPSESAVPSAAPSPTPLGNEPPTGAEAKAAIVSYLEKFDAAYRVGDSAFLLAHLDPAVIKAYSRSACKKSIESFAKSDFTTTVKSVSGPAAFTYKANGSSTIVALTYSITGQRTRAGKTSPLSMHLSFDKGDFFWFANGC